MIEETSEIDDGFYSRQRYVYGDEAMSSMSKANLFLSGINGLGIEIAKNITLAGVKSLTLHDTKLSTMEDLSTNFFITEQDIGKNRAEVCAHKVSELNPYVQILTNTKEILSEKEEELNFLEEYSCVIINEGTLTNLKRINEFCRKKGIPFIYCETKGVFSWVFNDFGDDFYVKDQTGEEERTGEILEITNSNPCIVCCLEPHGFSTGDYVKLTGIVGMTELNNDEKIHQVKVISRTEFSIDVDSTNFNKYERNGIFCESKMGTHLNFKSLSESLKNPEFLIADPAKFDMDQLMLGLKSLSKFKEEYGRDPHAWSEEDGNIFIEIARKIYLEEEKLKDLKDLKEKKDDEFLNIDLLHKISFTAEGYLCPISAFLGGLIGQEAIKAISNKFTPLKQWMCYDAREMVPSQLTKQEISKRFEEIKKYKNTRYYHQVICLGKNHHKKVCALRLFMVGCGAIGCELLKNFALMGVATQKDIDNKPGKMTITDNDLIEKSNLNRQFLFRPADINHSKSQVAREAVLKMNKDSNIEAHVIRVGPESENVYTNDFFQGLDMIVNALDNIAARLYMDTRSVISQRPLLESGTLGTKGHVEVIIPFITETYGSHRDPPEKSVPFCTLKSFPTSVEHTIEWARDKFETLFSMKIHAAKQALSSFKLLDQFFLQNQNKDDSQMNVDPPKVLGVRQVSKVLKSKPRSFEDCIHFARNLFEKSFTHKIMNLLHVFPEDHVLDDGVLFWAPPKKIPSIIYFNNKDPLHMDFIIHSAYLWADVWKVPKPEKELTQEEINKIISTTKIPKFVPKNKPIEVDENAEKDEKEKDEKDEKEKEAKEKEEDNYNKIEELKRLHEIMKNITNEIQKELEVFPLDFEKDDETNHHIDFIHCAAMIRAQNYGITQVNRLMTKKIAGKIIPAIATTTSVVSGLVSLELLKLASSKSLRGQRGRKGAFAYFDTKENEKSSQLEKSSEISKNVEYHFVLSDFKNAFLNIALPLLFLSEPGRINDSVIDFKDKKLHFNKWDKWEIHHPNISIEKFIEYCKNKYGLLVADINFNGKLIYANFISKCLEPSFLKKKLRVLFHLPKNTPYADFVVTFFNDKNEQVESPEFRLILTRGKQKKMRVEAKQK